MESGLKGDCSFRGVHFAYPSRPELSVLNGLSLSVDAGKTVALVGPSGSGKSTVIALLQRFYSPSQGQILLDGENIEELNVAWLRSQMALVSQEPVLFSTTIRYILSF